MSTISVDRPLKASVNSGRVEVTRAVRASATQVWETLTEPEIVSRWFGNLTSSLKVGDRTTLEFGDGDFFVLDVLQMEAPHTLQYVWRFLGIGPADTVTWNINDHDHGCLFTVTDSEERRTREAASLLRKGWLDFTERLEEFLRTGHSTRYNWRHELDASIELAGKRKAIWDVLFDAQLCRKWLSLSDSLIETDAFLRIEDGLQPSELRLLDVKLDAPKYAQFSLAHKEWLSPTSCNLELTQRGRDTLLTVSNNGWESISIDDEYQKQQRKRLCEFWIAALKRARALIH
jgi:uncharacterized protein YndB with AHSA1/START domain